MDVSDRIGVQNQIKRERVDHTERPLSGWKIWQIVKFVPSRDVCVILLASFSSVVSRSNGLHCCTASDKQYGMNALS